MYAEKQTRKGHLALPTTRSCPRTSDMHTIHFAAAFALCCSSASAQSIPSATPTWKGTGPGMNVTTGATMEHEAGNYVIGMALGGDVEDAAQMLGANVLSIIPGQAPVGLLQIATGTRATIKALVATDPMIQFVEPQRRLGAPITPGCSAGGGLSGSGCIAFFDGDPTPDEYFSQPALAALDVANLHPLLVGNLSIVAVIDTGVDASHTMLAGRVLPFGYDFVDRDTDPSEVANGIDEDADGLIDEAYGHGTHVAGTIALLNPDARILPLRVLDSDGNGTSFAVAEAIYFAVASGADVINLSLGMNGGSKAVRQAIFVAHEADVVVVAAAGNSGTQFVQFPARANDVLAVAAVDASDQKAAFSAYGDAVELAAPGDAIYSTMPGDQYAWWSGTSMAAAVASGAVSLLNSLSGTPFEVKGDDLLEDSSIPIDLFNPLYNELLGDGRIDPNAAAALMFGSL